MKKTCILTIALALAGFIVACGPRGGEAPSDPQELFQARCSRCHSTDRPLGKRKTEAQWRETVMRMKEKTFSGISDEEARTIIEYLSEIRGPE